MLKSMISDKNTLKQSHLQQLYNNMNDTKNFSLLGEDKQINDSENGDSKHRQGLEP